MTAAFSPSKVTQTRKPTLLPTYNSFPYVPDKSRADTVVLGNYYPMNVTKDMALARNFFNSQVIVLKMDSAVISFGFYMAGEAQALVRIALYNSSIQLTPQALIWSFPKQIQTVPGYNEVPIAMGTKYGNTNILDDMLTLWPLDLPLVAGRYWLAITADEDFGLGYHATSDGLFDTGQEPSLGAAENGHGFQPFRIQMKSTSIAEGEKLSYILDEPWPFRRRDYFPETYSGTSTLWRGALNLYVRAKPINADPYDDYYYDN